MSSARSRKVSDRIGEAPPGPGQERADARATVTQCQSTLNEVCVRPATWKQLVHTGQRSGAPVLYYAYWCDTHAEAIVQHRRQEGLNPGQLERLNVADPEPAR